MVHLVRGKHPTINNVTLTEDFYDSSTVTIARAGLFIIVSVHNHGLEMMWDRGKLAEIRTSFLNVAFDKPFLHFIRYI